MSSYLYELARKAAQEFAEREFRRSEFGRLATDISRAAKRGGLKSREVQQYARRLSAITGPRIARDMLAAMGLEEFESYAKKTGLSGKLQDLWEALGPVGKLIGIFSRPSRKVGGKVGLQRELQAAREFLQAFGHVVLPSPQESGVSAEDQQRLADLMRGMGWQVEEPGAGGAAGAGRRPAPLPGWTPRPSAPPIAGAPSIPTLPSRRPRPLPGWIPRPAIPPASPPPSQRPQPQAQPQSERTLARGKAGDFRRTEDVDLGGERLRTPILKTDPLISGEMIPVTSSNVHSIGFRLEPADQSPGSMPPSKGTLVIRFLTREKDGSKVPGPFYEYDDVPVLLFQEFRKAASKGKFVWDQIRVRGTVSGHKFSYRLTGIYRGYVPRQAGIKRGEQGEWYLKRRWRDPAGNLFESRLPEQRVTMSGPNRAEPNRGTPNRGR